MERDAERLRLLLVRHRRLDRLQAADDVDPVAVGQQRRRRSGSRGRPPRGRGRATRGRAASRSPSSRRRRAAARLTITIGSEGETCRIRPSQGPARSCASSSVRLPGTMPAPAHVLGERGHRQLLRDLRLADERAAAAPAHEVARRGRDRRARRARSGATRRGRRESWRSEGIASPIDELRRSGRAPAPGPRTAWARWSLMGAASYSTRHGGQDHSVDCRHRQRQFVGTISENGIDHLRDRLHTLARDDRVRASSAPKRAIRQAPTSISAPRSSSSS